MLNAAALPTTKKPANYNRQRLNAGGLFFIHIFLMLDGYTRLKAPHCKDVGMPWTITQPQTGIPFRVTNNRRLRAEISADSVKCPTKAGQ